ncbi:hypothetical protein OIU77_012077 [Salix suchowensis]|uniref:Uncharacterized protein n=1 Tax=Salix suchowensis TaxID=1278906 RepID=A0ABQ9A4H9_9ROSI|nr:hypothetical protein OIU77_012077 [Salix suchowensis]
MKEKIEAGDARYTPKREPWAFYIINISWGCGDETRDLAGGSYSEPNQNEDDPNPISPRQKRKKDDDEEEEEEDTPLPFPTDHRTNTIYYIMSELSMLAYPVQS